MATTAKKTAAKTTRSREGTDPRESGAPDKTAETKKDDEPAAAKPPVTRSKDNAEQEPQPRKRTDPLVTAVVPKPFTLTLEDHTLVTYDVGIQDMPKSHATHWFAKACGCEVRGE